MREYLVLLAVEVLDPVLMEDAEGLAGVRVNFEGVLKAVRIFLDPLELGVEEARRIINEGLAPLSFALVLISLHQRPEYGVVDGQPLEGVHRLDQLETHGAPDPPVSA